MKPEAAAEKLTTVLFKPPTYSALYNFIHNSKYNQVILFVAPVQLIFIYVNKQKWLRQTRFKVHQSPKAYIEDLKSVFAVQLTNSAE